MSPYIENMVQEALGLEISIVVLWPETAVQLRHEHSFRSASC